jgi:hypothetical protein
MAFDGRTDPIMDMKRKVHAPQKFENLDAKFVPITLTVGRLNRSQKEKIE